MTMQAVLTAVILLVVTYMFFSPRFPNAVVATVGALAVALTGTVEFKSVFTYYASTSIVLMAGMMIIGGGMFHTGFAGWMGNSIVKLTGKGERSIQIVAILAGGIMSSVCSGSPDDPVPHSLFHLPGLESVHQPGSAAHVCGYRLRQLYDASRVRHVLHHCLHPH